MAYTDFSHLQGSDHAILQVASLGAIFAAGLHILPELSVIPPAIYYSIMAWERYRAMHERLTVAEKQAEGAALVASSVAVAQRANAAKTKENTAAIAEVAAKADAAPQQIVVTLKGEDHGAG